MTDFQNTLVSAQLAKRVRSALEVREPLQFADKQPPIGLFQYLGEHLASGETHYTARPGLTELRQAIGRELGMVGCQTRDADGVIVTQGEGEALYVTLLGLDIGANSVIAISGDCAHLGLLAMLGITAVGDGNPEYAKAKTHLRTVGEGPSTTLPGESEAEFEIVAVGGLLYSGRTQEADLSAISEGAILIGHLNSLSGLDHFRMGFVAGPPDIVKKIQTWKQALSICSAAPSQRAAMFAISQGDVS